MEDKKKTVPRGETSNEPPNVEEHNQDGWCSPEFSSDGCILEDDKE